MAKPKKNANNEGTIYQRKDGRWEGSAYVLTTDGTYKRRSVYGKTWDEAHEKLTKLKADSLSGLPVATSKMTVAEYLTYWLTNVAKGKVRRTTYVKLRIPHPQLRHRRVRQEEARSAHRPRHPRLPREDGSHLPVLRAGQGQEAAGAQAALLRSPEVLQEAPV